jgi:hypothetical protein
MNRITSLIARACVLGGLALVPPFTFADDLSGPINISSINVTYHVDKDATTYSATSSIQPASLHSAGYKVTSLAVGDVTIRTLGPDLGDFSGTVKVNGAILFTYSGKWSDFNTAQSLLTSKLVKKSQLGINELMKGLVRERPIDLSVSGSVSKAPGSDNANSITVYVALQGNGHPE